jgi:hypothetical protein
MRSGHKAGPLRRWQPFPSQPTNPRWQTRTGVHNVRAGLAKDLTHRSHMAQSQEAFLADAKRNMIGTGHFADQRPTGGNHTGVMTRCNQSIRDFHRPTLNTACLKGRQQLHHTKRVA